MCIASCVHKVHILLLQIVVFCHREEGSGDEDGRGKLRGCIVRLMHGKNFATVTDTSPTSRYLHRLWKTCRQPLVIYPIRYPRSCTTTVIIFYLLIPGIIGVLLSDCYIYCNEQCIKCYYIILHYCIILYHMTLYYTILCYAIL